MENTYRNKVKFSAIYVDQPVYVNPVLGDEACLLRLVNLIDIDNNDYLLLKPVSLLTDDDAEIVAKFMHWGKEPKIVRQTISLLNLDHFPVIVTDYLRSKGYALPYMGLSVEKQIEYGWIKFLPFTVTRNEHN